MKKDVITQFVCFATNLDDNEFRGVWGQYASEFKTGKQKIILQRAVTGGKKNKYQYVSQYTCESENFRFAFMKGKNAEHFPDHTARVIQLGGYLPVQVQSTEEKGDVKIIAFLSAPETDFSFYHRQTYRHLNIYQAYFENCTYEYIMEFYVQESEAVALIDQLMTRSGIEAAMYKENSALRLVNTPG